jgi:hypothetical protein
MDIKNELQSLNSNDKLGLEIVKKLELEQLELLKKMHIFKSVLLANQLERLVSTDFFSKVGMNILKLNQKYHKDFGHNINFYLVDERRNKNYTYYDTFTVEQAVVLHKVFENFGMFNIELTDKKLMENMHISFDLKPGIKEKFLEIILSKELKSIYEYNNMGLELENNNSSSKKPKL